MQFLWNIVWRLLKGEVPYDPAIPFLGINTKIKSTNLERHMQAYVTLTLTAIARLQKQPKCPVTDKWIKTLQYIHTMEHYAALGEDEILQMSCTWDRAGRQSKSE